MANKNTIAIELIVNDNGTATIKSFGSATERELKKAETAGNNLGAGFAKTWAGIAAGAAGAIYVFNQVASTVAGSVKAFMDSETALFKLGMAMKNQGDYSRAALDDLVAYAEGLQKITAYEDDLLIAMMGNLKSYGMTNEEVKRATKVAMDFATAKANEGMTITTASELIGKAYAGNTQMLGRYGIMISDTVPKGEKFAAVLTQLNDRFGGSAQAELSTYAGQWKHLQNIWGDVSEVLGLVLLKAIEGLLTAGGLLAATFLTAGSAILGILRIVLAPFNLLLEGFAKLAELAGLDRTADALSSIANATKIAQVNIKEARDGVMSWTAKQYDALVATEKVNEAIERSGIVGKRTTAIDEEATAARKKAAEELAKALAKAADDNSTAMGIYWDTQDAERTTDAEADQKAREEAVARAKTNAEALAAAMGIFYDQETKDRKEQDEAWRKSEKAKLAAAAKLAEQLPQMYRDVYEDIRGEEKGYYDASLRLIQKQADAYIKAGMDRDVIRKWQVNEEEKAYIRMGKASDDWKDGVLAGLKEIERENTTWGTVFYNTTKTAFNDAGKAFGSNFRDIVKGDFDDLGTAWKGVWDNALINFGETLGKMITEAAAKDILMMFNAKWTSDSSNILGIINKGWDLWNLVSGSTSGTGGVSGQTSISGGYTGGSYAGYADGGPVPAGEPVWVGEKGRELFFSTTPGHILSHEQSMVYAARNGGFIPGYAEGTATAAQLATAAWVKSLTGFGWSGIDWDSILFTPNNGSGVWVDPDGTLHDIRQANGGGFLGDLLGQTLFGLFGDDRAVWTLAAIAATYGSYAAAAPAVGAATGGGGAAGGAGAGTAATAATYGSILYDAADWYSAAYSFIAGSAAASLKKSVISSLLGGVLSQIFGGSDQPQFSFNGIDGDLSWLSEGMAAIAPKSTPFAFSARNGLNVDYVPRDGFMVETHEGESIDVTPKEENARRRGARGRGNIVLEFHYHGTVIDGRKAANDLAARIYPQLKKLEAWGH